MVSAFEGVKDNFGEVAVANRADIQAAQAGVADEVEEF
jgi:hypothetical protein